MLYKHWWFMQPPSRSLGWLPKLVQAPGPWRLTCLSACCSCHLPATSAKGSAPPPPPPHQKLVPVGTREMVQGPSKPFSSCHRALAWEQPKVREDAGGKVPFTLARSSCGCSLRVKGKVRACERRKQPSESPRLAWGKEDEAAAPGRPARGGS